MISALEGKGPPMGRMVLVIPRAPTRKGSQVHGLAKNRFLCTAEEFLPGGGVQLPDNDLFLGADAMSFGPEFSEGGRCLCPENPLSGLGCLRGVGAILARQNKGP